MCGWLGLTKYRSIVLIEVSDARIACVYYTLLLLVGCYVVGVSIIYNKGYQKFDHPVGTTSAKVKGTGFVRPESGDIFNSSLIFNADDLVQLESDALFVTTRYVRTEQNLGKCEGDKKSGTCPECKKNDPNWAGNGITTGVCQDGHKFCEIAGWCPLERDHHDLKHIENIEKWTVFFKVNVEFPEFNVDKTNAAKEGETKPVLGYNLFSFNDIVEMAGSTWDDVKDEGAIILFTTNYDCNLDKAVEDQCEPKYEASRIDNVKGTISPGFNYREVVLHPDNQRKRITTKRYGLRIIFAIDGKAGRFDFITMLIVFGAGLGFFTVASFVCDIILQYIATNKDLYTRKKYQPVDPDTGSTTDVYDRMGGNQATYQQDSRA